MLIDEPPPCPPAPVYLLHRPHWCAPGCVAQELGAAAEAVKRAFPNATVYSQVSSRGPLRVEVVHAASGTVLWSGDQRSECRA